MKRVAVVGAAFDTDEFVALSALSEAEAFAHLDAALSAMLVERASTGYRFRHGLVREALLDVPVPVPGADEVPTFLGPPRYLGDELHTAAEVGTVNGLAWTPYGGEVLHIEAQTMAGLSVQKIYFQPDVNLDLAIS